MRKAQVYFTNIFKHLAITLFALPVVLFVLTPRADAATGILKQINFQGKVVNTNGTNVTNGNYSFVFSLYTVASGGTNIWTETKTITVTDGIFRTALGDLTALPGSVDFNTDNIYLGINFNSDGEMTPRVQFTAVPYAFNALKVAGLTVTDTTGTFTLTNGKTLSVSNSLTFAGTDSTTITFQGTDTYVGRATSDTLTNKTIGSSGLTFSGAATDITTATNEDLTLTPNGSGKLVLTSDFDTPVLVGSTANTLAVLSVRGGIANNAAFIVDNLNNGDLFTASSSGTTKFTIANNGTITATGSLTGLTGLTLSSGGITLGGTVGSGSQCLLGGATAAWGSCSAGAGSNWDIVSGVITPKLTSTLDLLLGSQATISAKFGFLNVNSGTPTASISANSGNNATTLTGLGVLGTVNMQTLTLGNSTTGNIVIDAGSNVVNLADATASRFALTDTNKNLTYGGLSQVLIDTLTDETGTGVAVFGTSPDITTSLTTGSTTFSLINTNATTVSFAGAATTLTIGGTTGTAALRNPTLELGGTGAATIQTNSNDDLTLTPNGTGNLVLTGDFDTQVLIGASGATTEFPLLVRSGIGNNAAFVIDNLNNGDLISASASGVTKFTVSTGGNITAGTYNGNTITTGTGVLTLAAGKTLTISNTLTFSGTDGSSLAIGAGGTLGSNAFTSTAYAPLASPTFSGTVTVPTPFTIGAVSMTSTGTQLNYLNAATGTTGTTNTNLVFSTSPALITPVLGAATGTSLALGTNPAAAGTLRLPNATYITARNAANSADINMIQIDASNLVAFGANTAAFTLGGAITGNSQSITGINSLSSTSLTITGSLTANGSTGSGLCLNGGATAAWGSCGAGGGGTDRWQVNNGLLSPGNGTVDLAIGGTSTGSAKFVFGGINAGTPTATFSGNLVMNSRPNSSQADVQKWTQVSGTIGTIGGGATTNIASVSASTIYNGSLYVGTSTINTQNQAEVYRYNGPVLSTWTKVSNATAGTIASGGTSGIASVSAMTTFDGYLYAGTSKANAAEVYRMDSAGVWTKVSNATAGTIGTRTLVDGVIAMAVFGGKLYAGTREGANAELLRYEGGTTWTNINTTPGAFVTTNTVNVDAITSLSTKGGFLYIGTQKNGDADVLKYSGGNGATGTAIFLSMNNAGTTGSYLVNNTATTGVNEITAMTVYNGALIVGIRRGLNQADILSLTDGTSTGTTAPDSWQRLNSVAGTITTGGTANIDSIGALAVYNGRLYAGTWETGAAEIYRYETPGVWTKVSGGAAGAIQGSPSTATKGIYGISVLQANSETLYAMTSKLTNGVEVYSYQSFLDQSYSLTFRATPGLAGGLQSGLQEEASIFFLASSSAVANNKSSQNGVFVFTNSIVTRNGAYDVAEDYPTRDDKLEPGDLVSIDSNERGFVKKSSGVYDYSVVGVYSENPALRLSQDADQINGGRTIPIALAGRAPVKVSTENGNIKSGDPLTSSSTPGVAMKAKKAGTIIGQAMENYEGTGVGKVMSYIKSASYNGSIAENFVGINSQATTFAQDVLTVLKSQDTGLSGSDIVTDRLIAGLEIITPKLTVDTLFAKRIKADQIDGLEILTDQISNIKFQISSLDEKLATSSGKVASASSSAALDNQAESLLSKLLARDLEDATASATMSQNGVVVTTLNVAGLSIFDNNIRVKGNGLFEGLLTVIDTLTTNNFIVNGISTFFGDAVFKAKVAFEGPTTFSNDVGGQAIVQKDDKRVEIVFDKEFEENPVVNASVSFDEERDKEGKVKSTDELEQAFFDAGYSYIIVNKSKKGFVIVLNKKAKEDISFTWTAFRVKEVKTIQSRAPD